MTPFDCELLREGWPAQPVNTISALTFLVAAVVLWRRGRQGAAAFTATAGVGSLWLHSAPSGAASWAHDVALYALLAFAAIEVWSALAARQPPLFAAAVFAVGLCLWFFSRTGGVLCDPDSLLQGHALWHGFAAAAAVILFSPHPIDAPARSHR